MLLVLHHVFDLMMRLWYANILLFRVFFLWFFPFFFCFLVFLFFCCFSLFVLVLYLIPLFLAYLNHFSHFFFFHVFSFVFLFPTFLGLFEPFFLSCTTFVYNIFFLSFLHLVGRYCFWLCDGILAMFLFLVTMCVSSGFELRACGSCVSSFT